MSMKKWQKLVGEKAEVEQQNANILAAIKNNKINKEFNLVSGEELFKPITSRLDKLQIGDSPPVVPKEEIPDYGMDEFDLNNPFDGDFNPDEETPSPSPSPSPSPTSTPPPSPTSTPLPPIAEEEETELMEEMEEMEEEQPSGGVKPQPSKSESKWGPPKEPGIRGSESTDLQSLNRMLTVNKDNPNYVVKSKKSKFHGFTLAELQEARDEILDRREGNKQPSASLHTSKVATELPIPQDEQEPDWEQEPEQEQELEMEGSGSVDPNALVERLHLSMASIQAGNTSLKLKKQVEQMLGLLVKQKEITQKEAYKILSNII